MRIFSHSRMGMSHHSLLKKTHGFFLEMLMGMNCFLMGMGRWLMEMSRHSIPQEPKYLAMGMSHHSQGI